MLAAVRDAIESGGFDAAAKRRLDCSTLAVAAATPRSAVILCAEYGWPEIDAADAVRSRRDADEVAALLAKAIESKTSIPAAVVVGVALLLGDVANCRAGSGRRADRGGGPPPLDRPLAGQGRRARDDGGVGRAGVELTRRATRRP